MTEFIKISLETCGQNASGRRPSRAASVLTKVEHLLLAGNFPTSHMPSSAIGNIQSQQVDLYPNPAGNDVTITRNSSNNESTGMRVDFVNQLGQIVKQVSTTENQLTTDISGLMNGYYFVRVIEGKQIACIPLYISK